MYVTSCHKSKIFGFQLEIFHILREDLQYLRECGTLLIKKGIFKFEIVMG